MILLKLTLLLKGTFLSCYFSDFFSCRKCWVWLCLKIIDVFQKDLNGPWSNAACMGYCLIAMRRAGLSPTAQSRVLRVLEGVFDDVSIEDAEKAGYANTEE